MACTAASRHSLTSTTSTWKDVANADFNSND
jgi:hypothetical protein